MSQAAILQNYGRIEEALVVCAALQDAGFDAAIDNFNHATVNWLMVPALGGIPVRLPASQLLDARAYLDELVSSVEDRLGEAAGASPEPILRKYWRARIVAFLYLGEWFLYFALWRAIRAAYLKFKAPNPHNIESNTPS
jgi:hypothetical protein